MVTEERGTSKRFAKKSMHASLARPSTGGAVSATFIASPPADISTQNTPPGLLTKWTGLLGTKLANGTVTVVLTPDSDPTNNPAKYGTATLLRARVFVRWLENGRTREVVLDTVKAY